MTINPFSAMAAIAESRIQEAMEKGEFDNLPGAGKPLVLEDEANIPEELRMAWKILKNSGCLPPELAERKEAADILECLENCPDEQQAVKQMRRLRVLLERMHGNSSLASMLESHDEYYQKILARLEAHERRMGGGKHKPE